MPRYLTPEWLEAADQAAVDNASLAAAAKGLELTVQHVVTDGPDGDAVYHVIVSDGTVHILGGEATDPTITFVQDWETAASIGRGALSAQGAFMTGRIRVRGDLPKLVEFGTLFGGIDDVFAELRAQTTY